MDIGDDLEEGTRESPSLVPEPQEMPDTPYESPAPVEPVREPVKV